MEMKDLARAYRIAIWYALFALTMILVLVTVHMVYDFRN